MPLSKVLTLLLSLAASAVAQETGVLKLDRALKRKLAKASKPSLKPRAKKLVETAHPILKEAFAATGKLTGGDFAAAAAAGPVPVDRAAAAPPRAAPSRLGGFATETTGSDCSAHSSTTFCYGMDGYVATDATNGLDDDWIMASPAPPSACASCGFFDDDDEHRAEFADRTDWADCVKCAEGDELMVFYEDCTGVCSPPAAKAYFEGFGFADLDASACIAHEPCGYEGYSLEGTVPPLETQLWSYSYEDDDPVDQSAADDGYPAYANWGTKTTYCSGSDDEVFGDFTDAAGCWAACHDAYPETVAIDFTSEGECYCQDACPCLAPHDAQVTGEILALESISEPDECSTACESREARYSECLGLDDDGYYYYYGDDGDDDWYSLFDATDSCAHVTAPDALFWDLCAANPALEVDAETAERCQGAWEAYAACEVEEGYKDYFSLDCDLDCAGGFTATASATGDEVAADCAAESRAVVGCWLDAGIPMDDDAAPIAYFEFLGETCAAAERSSEFRAMCANPKDGGESCEAAWTAYAECSYESRAREAGLACDLTCRAESDGAAATAVAALAAVVAAAVAALA